MLMPSIFRNSIFDDLMDDFTVPAFRGNTLFGSTRNLMKTDIKETDKGYELAIDLPGFKKEDVKAQLKDGYLTISAARDENRDKKDKKDNYLWKERYYGSTSRSYYVGENVTEEDIHAKFEDGILRLSVPKKETEKVEENKYISIEG